MAVTLLLLACGTSPGGKPAPDTAADTAVDTGDTADTSPPDTDSGGDTAACDDADGDGACAAEDCDDADARVYPGATDWCDGVDQDCDGDPVGAGMCGEVGTIDDLATWHWVGLAPDSWFGLGYVYDFGEARYQHGAVFGYEGTTAGTWGRAHLLVEGLSPDPEGWPDHVAGAWLGDDERQVWWIWPAGDFDGDGAEDLWVGTMDYASPLAHLRLQPGPPSAWPRGGVLASDVDYATWSDGLAENVTIGSANGRGRDIDGDGLDDHVTASTRGTTILFGRTEGVAGEHDFSREAWLQDDGALGFQENAMVASDFDGDGAREVTLYGGTSLPWLDGASLRVMAGNPLSEEANLLPRASGEVEASENGPVDVGDLDGDGTDDLVVDLTGGGSGHCLAWLSAAAIPGAGTLEDTIIARACGDFHDPAWNRDALADLDDDGVSDVTVSVEDTDLYWERGWFAIRCLVATSRLPIGGTLDLSDPAPCYNGLGWVVPDLDGDGIADFTAYSQEFDDADAEHYGRSDLLPGFAIPWDDPTKW